MTTQPPGFHHIPVMVEEVFLWLRIEPERVYADGTLGGGGHSEAILGLMKGSGILYGIDRDPDAIAATGERLKDHKNFRAIHGNFHDVKDLLPSGTKLSGGLLDLGVSSHQLDTKERGFSYHEDAPLDMRMDTSQGETAAELLNRISERELTQALYDFSDEKWAARIAKVLVERRRKYPLLTTGDLVEVVDAAIPKAVRRKDTAHPARRAFQAVRILVNAEITPLRQALDDWMDLMIPGARLCVITFHSIEDRVVKRAFQTMKNPCICPPKAPICTCGKTPIARILGGGAIAPAQTDVLQNPRARSAKLRVAERL
ncbi:MAG: 16S rRNA (cytosine(1402)-N(4))-methyltransferase RsmH [Eubacteriales bacterium]|nr:16S rRNA (cytosine(1402)-N(4))-methyltransferase RsmH [Eubacteriales bacterium]